MIGCVNPLYSKENHNFHDIILNALLISFMPYLVNYKVTFHDVAMIRYQVTAKRLHVFSDAVHDLPEWFYRQVEQMASDF